MKIIEVIPQLGMGGAERFVTDLCNEFVIKNQEIILVVLHSLKNHAFFARELSPRVKIVSMNKQMGFDLKLFFRLAKFLFKEKPDIVHTHLRGIVYSLLAWLRPFHHSRYFHTVHSSSPREAEDGIGLLLRKIAFSMHKVLPVNISESSRLSFYGIYKMPSALIYNGRPEYSFHAEEWKKAKTEVDSYRKTPNTIILVNVARVEEVKNQLELAKAVKSANSDYSVSVELLIIGQVKDCRIEQEIKGLHSSHVHLLGARTNSRDYMCVSDAFVLSSLCEGMPITLIEAFSVGCIPICTPVGGMPDMIEDNFNGLLAKGVLKEDLTNLILRFAALTENQRRIMQQESKKSFEKYNMSNCAEHYMKLFSNEHKNKKYVKTLYS